MKVKRLAIVERGKGKRNFYCFTTKDVCKCGFVGHGASARAAMEDIKVAIEEERKDAAGRGETFPEVELEFRFDIGSFFDYYPLDATAVAKYIGMNASVLRQYVTALREPKQAQIEKIRNGIAMLSKDLGLGMMIDKPTTAYV